MQMWVRKKVLFIARCCFGFVRKKTRAAAFNGQCIAGCEVAIAGGSVIRRGSLAHGRIEENQVITLGEWVVLT